MADAKISQLPDGGTIQPADQVPVNRSGTTMRAAGVMPVGASYLVASTVDHDGTAATEFTLVSGAGTDVAINTGNPAQIDIVAAGWYVVSYQFDAYPNAAGVFSDAYVEISYTGPSLSAVPLGFARSGGDPQFSGRITTAPMHLDAGYLGISSFAGAPAPGNWTFQGVPSALHIVRMA